MTTPPPTDRPPSALTRFAFFQARLALAEARWSIFKTSDESDCLVIEGICCSPRGEQRPFRVGVDVDAQGTPKP